MRWFSRKLVFAESTVRGQWGGQAPAGGGGKSRQSVTQRRLLRARGPLRMTVNFKRLQQKEQNKSKGEA